MVDAGTSLVDTGYRTPLVDIPTQLPAAYRSSATRGTVAMVLVAIASAAYGVQLIAQVSQLGLLDAAAAGTLTAAEADASDARVAMVAGLGSLAYIISGIAVLAWLWRLADNVRWLTSGTVRWTRNEAVGWWFVPFANWVMPYRVVRDTFQALALGPAATIVTVWWTCHVIASATGWLVMLASRSSMDTLDGIRAVVVITAAMIALEIVAGGLLVVIIRRIEGFVRAREQGIAAAVSAAPAWGHPGAHEAWVPPTASPTEVAEPPAPDARTIESLVASPAGPIAPPPPPPPA